MTYPTTPTFKPTGHERTDRQFDILRRYLDQLRDHFQGASTGTPPATPPPVVPTPPVVVPTLQLPAGHRTITGTVNAPNGSAVDGDQDHAPGFHIEGNITSKWYCLFAGVPWRVVNSNLVSTGPGDGYCIRVTAGGEILNSTLDNTANPNTKNTLRATGFDYLRIDGVRSVGDGWMLGFAAGDDVNNRLGGSGLVVSASRIEIPSNRVRQPCIELSDTLNNSRWENVDLITPWPDRAINLWYGSSGHVFEGCTVNGSPLSASNIRHVNSEGEPQPLQNVQVIA